MIAGLGGVVGYRDLHLVDAGFYRPTLNSGTYSAALRCEA